MNYAQGVLTVRGGMTSHAAVVARGMGTCCVSGCGEINIDENAKKFELAGRTYTEEIGFLLMVLQVAFMARLFLQFLLL